MVIAARSRSGSPSTSCRAATSSPPGTCGTCRCRAPRSPSWRPGWCSSSCRATSTCRSARCSASSATRWRWCRPTGSSSFFGVDAARVDGLADKVVRLGRRPGLRPPARGARSAASQGFLVAYVGVPAFIVTLGRLPRLARPHLPRWAASRARRSLRSTPTFQLLGGGGEGLARRVAQLAGRRSSPARGIVLSLVLARRRRQRHELARAPDVGRDRARRRRLRRRCIAGVGLVANQLRLADHRQADRHRLPGRDPDRRHAADELPRPAPPLRPLRVRVRRQPRGRRARRHQHPAHRDVHVRR